VGSIIKHHLNTPSPLLLSLLLFSLCVSNSLALRRGPCCALCFHFHNVRWLAGWQCALGLQSDDGDDDRVLGSALSPRQICAEDGIFRGIRADYELGRHLIKYFNSLR
jgi:hypothetical protein